MTMSRLAGEPHQGGIAELRDMMREAQEIAERSARTMRGRRHDVMDFLLDTRVLPDGYVRDAPEAPLFGVDVVYDESAPAGSVTLLSATGRTLTIFQQAPDGSWYQFTPSAEPPR